MARHLGIARFRPHPHDREVLGLVLPALGALSAEPLFVLTDTVIMGRLGTTQLGGLAVGSSLLLAAYASLIVLSYGTTATVARLVGAGDHRGAADHGTQAMWLAAGIGVVVAAAGLALSSPLVELFRPTEAVRDQALTYLRISLAGMPAMVLALAGVGYLRGVDHTRTALVVTTASVAVKVGLEWVWVLRLGHGIGAAALSTVVVQWGVALIYLAWVHRAAARHALALRPDGATLTRLATVAGDLFAHGAALQGAFLVAAIVAARIGVPDLAAHQIGYEVLVVVTLALEGVAVAGESVAGRLLGAGRLDAARAVGRRLVGWGLAAGVALAVLVLAVRPVLPGWFSADPLVVDLTGLVLVFVALIQPFNGVAVAMDGVLVTGGDVAFVKWATFGALAVFVPLAWLVLVYDGGLGWLWAALLLLVALRAVAVACRAGTGAWAAAEPAVRSTSCSTAATAS